MSKHSLKIDWASHKAADYACKNWHYSKSLPVGKLVKVGAWENGKFVGVVLFGRGANRNMANAYGCSQAECVELVRIALTKHKAPVSRIMSLSLKFLKKANSGLKMVVSYADTMQGHHGGIYQATNWIYSGLTEKANLIMVNGKVTHKKTIYSKYGHNNLEKLKEAGLKVQQIKSTGKHRYLMPLDNEMRDKLKSLSKPYPKRDKQATSGDQSESGGAAPTVTLQS